MLERKQKRIKRHNRIRAKVIGTKARPRLCMFCSNADIYAQLIDDEKGKVLASINDVKLKIKSSSLKKETKDGESKRLGKVAVAYEVGKTVAELAKEIKVQEIVFDRGGFKYHGVVKALAEGAREGGLKF